MLYGRVSGKAVGEVMGEFQRTDARFDLHVTLSISGKRHVFFSNSAFSGP
jgi:hypothetical protein